mgnify:CR=1 FL=1
MIKIKLSTRLVILTKTKAYKIPFDFRGYLQGKNEGKIWNKYKKTKLLAPLIWERLGFVCQKRVNLVEFIDAKQIKNIKKIIPIFNFNNCDLYNSQNWGIYRGKIVLLDYGINKRISKMYKPKK